MVWGHKGWTEGCMWRPATYRLGDVVLEGPKSHPSAGAHVCMPARKPSSNKVSPPPAHQQRPQPAHKAALHATSRCAVGFQACVTHVHSSVHRLLQTVHHKASQIPQTCLRPFSAVCCLRTGCCTRFCHETTQEAPHPAGNHLTGPCHTPTVAHTKNVDRHTEQATHQHRD